MYCRWDDFFGNCMSLFKGKCRVDILVSVRSWLGCSFNTLYCQAPWSRGCLRKCSSVC